MYGFYRCAAVSPRLQVGDIEFNVTKTIEAAKLAQKEGAAVAVFPELGITGYSCGDLFFQDQLLSATRHAIKTIAQQFQESSLILVVGAPLVWQNNLYNCAFILQRGKVMGIIPKQHIPNYREFYEKRWFQSGRVVKNERLTCAILGDSIPFGTEFLFSSGELLKLGVEICEDVWAVVPPSSYQAMAGANLLLNLSASDVEVGKAEYRRQLIAQQSARCLAAYVYASSGVGESSTDLVFDGHCLIAENGTIVAENRRFERDVSIVYSDIDLKKLQGIRLSESSLGDSQLPQNMNFTEITLEEVPQVADLEHAVIVKHPFVPHAKEERAAHCAEIFHIQAAGLAKRFEHVRSRKLVLGISGGLDSTLALLVCVEALRLVKRDNLDIIAVTMPGFGTTSRTYQNALQLIKLLGAECREIDIKAACMDHFAAIGHDPEQHDVTYENVQARERTQLLMDIANREGGLLVGTGDLSEIALGWSTYNGDHMSMYAVNCSVPKTLIRYLIDWVAEQGNESLGEVLRDIIATPVSPELLPNKADADITQRTEDIIGPYELHDFFLYHFVKYGAAPEKIAFLAKHAFQAEYDGKVIDKYLTLFIKRFFSQQFKRSCMPDGVKVGSISLSPRGDWRMPSDSHSSTWLK